jgi:hypothetical protein
MILTDGESDPDRHSYPRHSHDVSSLWRLDHRVLAACVPYPARTKPTTANPPSDTFINLADGKLNGQKAFMTGALKVKGNVSGAWRGATRSALCARSIGTDV